MVPFEPLRLHIQSPVFLYTLKGLPRALNHKKPVSARYNRFLDPDTTGQDAVSLTRTQNFCNIGSIMLTLDQDLDEKTRF